MAKFGYVQRRMAVEKVKQLTVLAIFALLFLVFTLSALHHRYSAYFVGLKNLNTKEKIGKFYNSGHDITNLHFDSVINLDETIDITTTSSQSLVLFGGGGMISGEISTHENTITYSLYLLINEDSYVVFCSNAKNIDFSENKILARNKYKDINQEIISAFDFLDKPVYVFYSESNRFPVAWLLLTITIALSSIFFYVMLSPRIQKKSKFGRLLIKFGDYDILTEEINEQVKNPICKITSYIICKDYIVKSEIGKDEIIPIKAIEIVELIPDKEYPDEVTEIKISFTRNNVLKTCSLFMYDKDSEQTILNHIASQNKQLEEVYEI